MASNDKLSSNAQSEENSFSFGIRRYASKGPRKLFVQRKPSLGPAFDGALQNKRALLRVLSEFAPY